MMIKKTSLFLLLASFIMSPALVVAEPDLRIGFVGPLSGNAAVLGVDALPAIQLAIEEEREKGVEIELLIEDDTYLTSSTLKSYKKLVEVDKVDALFILTYGGLFALEKTIERDGVFVIDTLDCDEPIAEIQARNVICISKGTEDMGEVVARSLIKHGVKSTTVFYFDGDPFMGILADATKKYLEKNGTVSIVEYQGYSNTTDFRSMLLKAKNRKSGSYIFYGYDDLGNALAQARGIGITEPFYAVNTVASPGFQKTAGAALEGTWVSTYMAPRTERYRNFIDKFEKKTGTKPSFEPSTFPSYDSVKLMADAVRKHRKLKSSQPLRDFLTEYFYSVENYDGLSGTITIDDDGATRSLKNDLFKFTAGELIQ